MLQPLGKPWVEKFRHVEDRVGLMICLDSIVPSSQIDFKMENGVHHSQPYQLSSRIISLHLHEVSGKKSNWKLLSLSEDAQDA